MAEYLEDSWLAEHLLHDYEVGKIDAYTLLRLIPEQYAPGKVKLLEALEVLLNEGYKIQRRDL